MLGQNASLVEVVIDANKIGSGNMEMEKMQNSFVTSFRECFAINKCLRSLSMRSCQLGNLSLTRLSLGLAQNNSLKELNLKGNEISDQGAEELAICIK